MRFLAEESGVTAIEYGLIAGLIATMMITILAITGDTLSMMVDGVRSALLTATDIP